MVKRALRSLRPSVTIRVRLCALALLVPLGVRSQEPGPRSENALRNEWSAPEPSGRDNPTLCCLGVLSVLGG
jgi:hypothetical protein